MDEHNGPAGGQPLLNCKILTLAAIVALGAVMTILDRRDIEVTRDDARKRGPGMTPRASAGCPAPSRCATHLRRSWRSRRAV